MKVAVNQPYIFPYIGYFQLINAVDIFVFYDDVNFIKQGWINRNRILVSNKDYLFTIPLENASSFNEIKNTKINTILFEKWKKKFYVTLEQSYKKAPHFEQTFQIIKEILDKNYTDIASLSMESCVSISKYLNIKTKFEVSSENYHMSKGIGKEERIFDILDKNNASSYINTIAGISLYEKEKFLQKENELQFLKPKSIVYKQFENEFVPWLSIIDVMMFNSKEDINKMINHYELV